MDIIEDPDHWFERESPTGTAVESQEGQKAELLDSFCESDLRKLRDRSDREVIDQTLVTRDFPELDMEWPAIAARGKITRAPRTPEKYPELSEAIAKSAYSPQFRDLRIFEEYVGSYEELPQTLQKEIINLIVSTKRNQEFIPSPSLVRAHPSIVKYCFGIGDSDDIERFVVARLLRSDVGSTVPQDPTGALNRHKQWYVEQGWLDNWNVTTGGEQAWQYTDGSANERTQWEAAAILERAKANVSFSVENKLEKASVNVLPPDSFGELDSNLVAILAESATSTAYSKAQEAAAKQGLLERAEKLDQSEDDILKFVKESRPGRLEDDVLMQVEPVPVDLYESVPENDLQAVLSALEPGKLIPALDHAISEEQPELERTIDALRELVETLGPLLPEATEINAIIDRAEEMMALLEPRPPSSPDDCIRLYDDIFKREAELSTEFSNTEAKARDAVLAVSEKYIRDNYRQWAVASEADRPVAMITDIPARIERLLNDHDHILLIISDGFGLRQWLEARHQNETIDEWQSAGIISNTTMTTVFPSETGTGHYSLFTGQFPSEHGRDDIGSTLYPNDDNLFARAKQKGAFTQALSYLRPDHGFSEVLNETADDFHHLDGLRAEAAALSGSAVGHIANAVNSHEMSVTLLQHNQIDQLHEGTDHIADSLIPGVARDVVEFIKKLAYRLGGDLLPILTADHGMVRTGDTLKSLSHGGEARKLLKQKNETLGEWGQRVFELESKSGGQSFQQNSKSWVLEVLSEQQMQQLKAQTEQKFDGRVGRFKRRYYSAGDPMPATHGGFTFDEMFIPFATFDTEAISKTLKE